MSNDNNSPSPLFCCSLFEEFFEKGHIQLSRFFRGFSSGFWNGWIGDLSSIREGRIKFCPFCGYCLQALYDAKFRAKHVELYRKQFEEYKRKHAK